MLHAVLFLIIYVQVLAASSDNYYKILCVCVRACVRACVCVCVSVLVREREREREREGEIEGDSVMSTQQERRIH